MRRTDRIDAILGGLVAGASIGLGVLLAAWLVSALVVGTVAIGQRVAGAW